VFATEQLGSQYRYAMVLHTDRPCPHVQLTVQAENKAGKTLKVDPAGLLRWRSQFASQLREHGIAANATPKKMRGQPADRRSRGLDAAMRYGRSTLQRQKIEHVAAQLREGVPSKEASAKVALLRQREYIKAHWQTLATALRTQGEQNLANEVEQFVQTLPPVLTDNERIAEKLLKEIERQRERIASQPTAQQRSVRERDPPVR
jgi:hypothetical protein